ncbi:MAG TPA: hypothetical protein PLI62_13825, partial [Spirochaetota bacterium]|nr:hypothetical protein [Spirochaetota bacterium]
MNIQINKYLDKITMMLSICQYKIRYHNQFNYYNKPEHSSFQGNNNVSQFYRHHAARRLYCHFRASRYT